MNGHETDILTKLLEDFKEVKQDIKDTKNAVIETAKDLAVTTNNVEQLKVQVAVINNKLEHWTQKGCPRGEVTATKIEVLDTRMNKIEQKTDDNEKYIDSVAITNQKAALIGSSSGAGAGALLSAIVNAVIAFFTRG